ncbi:MAG: hypothetical protein EHM41_00310 [Chloroflexi bacterium]|nr:MAG: hypothetical protein EHM41_00310 [Chloroflexota bacterium]
MDMTLGVCLFIICALLALVVILATGMKKSSDKLINDLTNKLIAKDLTEYAMSKSALDSTPKDELKKIGAENKLAVKAAQIEQQMVERQLTGVQV